MKNTNRSIWSITMIAIAHCFTSVTSFSMRNGYYSSSALTKKQNNNSLQTSTTAIAVVTSTTTAATANTRPDLQAIVEENMFMHADAVRKSEETFYGYYPGGFTEFNVEQCPCGWISYHLSSKEDATDHTLDMHNMVLGNDTLAGEVVPTPSAAVLGNINIWDTLFQLDERIIPPPFQSTDLARVSQTPILTPDECNDIISESEAHYWGWGTSNERYGTPSHRVGYMIKLEDLSFTYTFVNFELLPRLFPAIVSAYPHVVTSPENLRLGGCRIVKYDASEGRVELGLHRDGLLITANIALNDLNAYDGGGTIVEGVNEPIKLSMGHVLLHPGDVKHGGAPITSGVRYALVSFIFDATIVPHEKYCQDRMSRDVEAARLIPIDDVSRMEEREGLLMSATKHCADAYSFGNMNFGDNDCVGYDEIVEHFGKITTLPMV